MPYTVSQTAAENLIYQRAASQQFEERVENWQERLTQGLCLETLEQELHRWAALSFGQFLRGLNALQVHILEHWSRITDLEIYNWLVSLQKTIRSYLLLHPKQALASLRQETLQTLQGWCETQLLEPDAESLTEIVQSLLTELAVYQPYIDDGLYCQVMRQLTDLRTLAPQEYTDLVVKQTEQALTSAFNQAKRQQFWETLNPWRLAENSAQWLVATGRWLANTAQPSISVETLGNWLDTGWGSSWGLAQQGARYAIKHPMHIATSGLMWQVRLATAFKSGAPDFQARCESDGKAQRELWMPWEAVGNGHVICREQGREWIDEMPSIYGKTMKNYH